MNFNPRSYLFVPAERPDRYQKALDSGADAVIIDLDDSIAFANKHTARDMLCRWLSTAECEDQSVFVRVNAVNTEWHADDVEAIRPFNQLAGVMLPKAEDAQSLNQLGAKLSQDMVLLPLVETAKGIEHAAQIAACSRVHSLAIGLLDLKVDIGIDNDREGLVYARSRLVFASCAAGIAAPVDGVTTAFNDPTQLESDINYGKAFGYWGKHCIHPSQVAAVNAAYLPDDEAIEWARGVLDAVANSRHGAIQFRDQMVDRPVVLKARQILSKSK